MAEDADGARRSHRARAARRRVLGAGDVEPLAVGARVGDAAAAVVALGADLAVGGATRAEHRAGGARRLKARREAYAAQQAEGGGAVGPAPGSGNNHLWPIYLIGPYLVIWDTRRFALCFS